MCIFAFMAGLLNCMGNTVFSASLMLALPEENRSAILGSIRSVTVGGTALSTLICGFLGETLPLCIIFSVGNIISLIPMLWLCFHPETKRFILEHAD